MSCYLSSRTDYEYKSLCQNRLYYLFLFAFRLDERVAQVDNNKGRTRIGGARWHQKLAMSPGWVEINLGRMASPCLVVYCSNMTRCSCPVTRDTWNPGEFTVHKSSVTHDTSSLWHISSREYEGSDAGSMSSTSGDDGVYETFGLDPCQAVALDSRTWLRMLIEHNSRNPDKSKKIVISA